MVNQPDDTDAASILSVGNRLFETVEHGNLDELHDIFAPGAGVWHNTDNSITDIPTTIENLKKIRGSAAVFRYDDIRRLPTPEGFVQQHTLLIEMADGRVIRDICCCICRVKDGRITHMDAYHDSAATGAMAHKANEAGTSVG
jgi:ketosteroid isomerase-like protein